jgi:SAM-dependent methyltransferase
MLSNTVAKLRCPYPRKKGVCGGALVANAIEATSLADAPAIREIRSGHLSCQSCKARYPILAGVAVVVPDVGGYLLEHVKGVSALVPDEAIPQEFLQDYLAAKDEIQFGHIEEDLEAERVNALYLMNHYLNARDAAEPWWKSRQGQGSPLLARLIEEHWDRGPFSVIADWLKNFPTPSKPSVVELGCGVGGLEPRIRSQAQSYLGVDSSFASIARARHLALGFEWNGQTRIPEDLLQGPVSRKISIRPGQPNGAHSDFVVGDLALPPLATGLWDLSIALNAIDMLDEPADLAEVQSLVLKPQGYAIQSAPYIWHESVAKKLRKRLPKEVRDSAAAAEWLYSQAGLKVVRREDQVPWLFFKHLRQMEVYAVHLFMAQKG